MEDKELIEKAAEVIDIRKSGDKLIGDVGCALVTDKGNLYRGVCIDVPSGLGFCAEHNAIGSMTTAGESRIQKIVAVWKDEKGDIFIVSPCGRCREFIRQIDEANMDTEVVLAGNRNAPLKELLPYANSFIKI